MGSAVSSPVGLGGAPAEIEFGDNFSLKIGHLVATILMIFPKLYQPQKSQPKQRRLFLVRGRGPIS